MEAYIGALSDATAKSPFAGSKGEAVTNIEMRLQEAVARMHDPLGGVHCLDFANTIEPRGGPPPLALPPGYHLRDELSGYEDLVAWAVHKGTLDAAAAKTMLNAADKDPHGAHVILSRAHMLRDAIYRACWLVAQGESPARDDLSVIMREYADATAHASLVVSGTTIDWDWPERGASLARPLWPVARSAVDLLSSGDRERIKVCPGPGRPPVACAWLFYDTTKNGSRRWCSMADCGAVTKAKLQTERRRAKRAAPHP
jgi:predicted RNA-binding Zn ribbon-like protein